MTSELAYSSSCLEYEFCEVRMHVLAYIPAQSREDGFEGLLCAYEAHYILWGWIDMRHGECIEDRKRRSGYGIDVPCTRRNLANGLLLATRASSGSALVCAPAGALSWS
jgi:hypothetical protein